MRLPARLAAPTALRCWLCGLSQSARQPLRPRHTPEKLSAKAATMEPPYTVSSEPSCEVQLMEADASVALAGTDCVVTAPVAAELAAWPWKSKLQVCLRGTMPSAPRCWRTQQRTGCRGTPRPLHRKLSCLAQSLQLRRAPQAGPAPGYFWQARRCGAALTASAPGRRRRPLALPGH